MKAEETARQGHLETSRKDEESHEQLLRDRHRFLVDRLRADIRYFVHALQEFVKAPEEPGQPRTPDQWIKDMLKDVNAHAEGVGAASEADAATLEPVVALLNYRDRVLSCILTGALYRKAMLDEDLQLPSDPTGPMGELTELVRVLRARGEPAPEKYPMREMPSAGEPGHFTYQQLKKQGEQAEAQGAGAAEQSAFQARLLVMLREMQTLDRDLRQMKFGRKVSVSTGKSLASDEMRREIAKLFDKCARLEHELQMSKAQRHAAVDVQVELNTKKCEDADKEIKKNMNRVQKLEGELQGLRAESAIVIREKAELVEKNQKMAQEHLPVLDKMDKQLALLRESVDRLTADAEMLSQMFRLQVQEHRRTTEERDEKAQELARVNRVLRSERLKNQLKDVELGKKETLHLRTTEARQATHESYKEGKALIQEAEERMRQKEVDWQRMQTEVRIREEKVAWLKDEMRRATQAIDELEQQKKECMKEFKAATGRPYAMLLEQYKVPKQGREAKAGS